MLNKVQSQQNRAIKFLYNKEFYTPTISFHEDFNILSVKVHILKFVYKQQNAIYPPIFHNCYTLNQEINSYNAWQSHILYQQQIINNYGMNTIEYYETIVIEYNNL